MAACAIGQLIDATTGAHIWADRFGGATDDIFDLQDQVTVKVPATISPRLGQAEIERVKHKPTASLDAYDYFLHGMANIHELGREGDERSAPTVLPGKPVRP
jgi:hypothetical protein